MTEQFTTPSASTLNPKAMPYDDFEADVRAAIENYQKLNANQKKRHLDFLQKMLDDSAWAKSGTGVKGKNVPFNKEDIDFKTVAEVLVENELQEQLEKIGFTPDAQQKVAALFFEAVEQRLKDDPFRQHLVEVLSECCPSPFIPNEKLDVVEMLANKIADLEAEIDDVENENLKLMQGINQHYEEMCKPPVTRSPRRSTVNECMFEADLDNEDAYYNQPQFTGRMAAYLRAMGGDDLE